ncbi:MAG: hypothetical protein JW910_12665, partial [Anaerolineae bacterium]|nr:hypothetical protein [Anaerolineae bacterium]
MNARKLIPLAAVVLLLLPLLTAFGPPQQDPDPAIVMTIQAGYGLHFRPDYWLPLFITVSNDGPDVRGSLRVRAETNAGLGDTTYSAPIDLPRQSRKQVFLYIAPQSYARQIIVELVAEDGAVLAIANSQLLPVQPADVLAAVITDSPGGSVDLGGIPIGAGQSYQSNISTEQIAPQADALLPLNLMVFSDVDTGQLTVEQVQAITDWVLAGGHLVVTGGPNYRLTAEGLRDLLPLDLTGTSTLDDLTPLAAYAGRPGDALAEPDIIA